MKSCPDGGKTGTSTKKGDSDGESGLTLDSNEDDGALEKVETVGPVQRSDAINTAIVLVVVFIIIGGVVYAVYRIIKRQSRLTI